jgi:hypothetical protein
MRLYLHIGHYKTGTTAFQAYCAANAAGLARRGLHYVRTGRLPVAPTNHAGLSVPLAQAHGFAAPRWYRGGPEVDAAYEALREELAGVRAGKALISSEEFVQLALREDADAALADLATRLAPHRVTVIFTLREPLSLLTSWYAQVSRAPRARPTLLDFFMALDPAFLAQHTIVGRFRAAFGARAVRVLVHDGAGRAQMHRLLWATRTFPYSRATFPVANVTDGQEMLEADRYARIAAGGEAGLTVSKVSAEDLATKIAMVNAGYARLADEVRGAPASALSLVALAGRYRDLIQPASERIALDVREARALDRLATDTGAAAFAQAAGMIRASQANERERA